MDAGESRQCRMSVRVTLSFYSSLPNPTWELTPAQARSLQVQLSVALRARSGGETTYRGGLGYSGFLVDASDVDWPVSTCLISDGAIDAPEVPRVLVDAGRRIETFLFNTFPGLTPTSPIARGVARALARRGLYRPHVICSETVPEGTPSAFAPTWDPGPWNARPFRIHNDCYNYANDLRSDNPRSASLAEPGFGFADGSPCQTDPCGCGNYKVAAASDRLKPAQPFVDQDHVEGEWFVALCVGRGPYIGDSHWYRQDGNGFWSHKPGAQKARNCDEAGHLISDPRDADRWHLDDNSPAYEFCAFFKTGPQVRIAGRH